MTPTGRTQMPTSGWNRRAIALRGTSVSAQIGRQNAFAVLMTSAADARPFHRSRRSRPDRRVGRGPRTRLSARTGIRSRGACGWARRCQVRSRADSHAGRAGAQGRAARPRLQARASGDCARLRPRPRGPRESSPWDGPIRSSQVPAPAHPARRAPAPTHLAPARPAPVRRATRRRRLRPAASAPGTADKHRACALTTKPRPIGGAAPRKVDDQVLCRMVTRQAHARSPRRSRRRPMARRRRDFTVPSGRFSSCAISAWGLSEKYDWRITSACSGGSFKRA